MSDFTLHAANVVTPAGCLSNATVWVRDGLIVDLHADCDCADASTAPTGWLLPGFVDTQVNGGGGVLFNDDPSAATIRRIGDAHARFGTTAFLPTLISDDLSVVDAGMRAVEHAIAQGVPGVVGIHIEGPFLSTARKGIHDQTKFRRLDDAAIALLSSLAVGRTLVTLAPEYADPEQITRLVRAGVAVAAGHTDADYATMRRALDAGVTGFTHLFNAMSQLGHRAPGVVGAALEDEASYCGIIVDGHHVDATALRLAIRLKTVARMMLVSDAMPPVGTDMTSFSIGGQRIDLRDGVLTGPDGTLAGCALDMAQALRNAVGTLGVSVEQAAEMAAGAPARFIGLDDRGELRIGARADMILFDDQLQVRQVWRCGVPVFQNGHFDATAAVATEPA